MSAETIHDPEAERLPTGRAGENGAGELTPALAPPRPVIGIWPAGTGVVIQYTRQEGGALIPAEGGGVLHNLQTLAQLGAGAGGAGIRAALHDAVDRAVDALEQIGG